MVAKEIIVKLIGDTKDLQKNLDSSKKSLQGWSDGFTNVGKKAGVAFAGLTGVLALAGGGALKAAGQFENFETTLKVMLGTTEKAKARMKEIEKFAWETPFELTEVVQLANQLQTIGKYSKENMTILGDLAAASGKPIAQVASAYQKLATGQKGVAQDMFRDLLISTDDWVKATGKATFTAEDMLAALPKLMADKSFSGMMKENSETFEALGAGISDTMNLIMKDIGEIFLPIAKQVQKQIISILGGIREFVQENPRIVKIATAFLLIATALAGVVTGVSFVGAFILKLIPGFKLMIAIVGNIAKAVRVLGIVMKTTFLTNPVFLLIAALVLVGVHIYKLMKSGMTFKEAFKSMIDSVISYFKNLWGSIKKIGAKIAKFFKKKPAEETAEEVTETANEEVKKKKAVSSAGTGSKKDAVLWTEDDANTHATSYMSAFLSSVQNNGDILLAIGEEMATQIATSLVTSLLENTFIGLQAFSQSLTSLTNTLLSPFLKPIDMAVGTIVKSFSGLINNLTNLFKNSPVGQAVMAFMNMILQPVKLAQIAILTVAKLSAVAWALMMAIPTAGASLGAIPVALAEWGAGAASIAAIGFASGTSGIEEDMVGQLSKGEMVIPETFSEGIKSGELTLGSSDSSQSIGVSLDGATFNGSFDNDMAMSIGEKIALAIKNNVMSPLPS